MPPVNPAVTGLQQAWSPETDPLGIGLQQQARDRQFAYKAGLGSSPAPVGPLPDPRWDAFFQATDNAAGGAPVKFGQMPSAHQGMGPSLADDPYWQLKNAEMSPMGTPQVSPFHSTQLGAPRSSSPFQDPSAPDPISGLQKAGPRRRG